MRPLACVVVVMAAPGVAGATCASPSEVVSPPSGSIVPPAPVIYVFTPRSSPAIAAESGGKRLAVEVELVADVHAFEGRKVTIPLRSGAFTLWVGEARWEYAIDPSWRRETNLETRVASWWRRRFSWTCSGEEALYLRPSVDAPAYRVEWAASAEDYRQGLREYRVFPRSTDDFWRWRDGKHAPDVGLGYLNCMGETFPVSKDVAYLGVAALYPDGSEDPASPEPLVLAVRTWIPDELQGFLKVNPAALVDVARVAIRIDSKAAAPPPPATLAAALARLGTPVAAALGALALVVFLVLRRRLR